MKHETSATSSLQMMSNLSIKTSVTFLSSEYFLLNGSSFHFHSLINCSGNEKIIANAKHSEIKTAQFLFHI